MALNKDFYEEIFDKEIYWTDLANKKLLNIYYLNGNGGIKEFYINKRNNLQAEFEINQNLTLKFFIDIIDSILIEINSLTENYNKGINIEIDSLTNLFIINQMSNNIKGYNFSLKH